MTGTEIMNQDGQQEVYLALRNMFQGQHAHLRQSKRIRTLIQVKPQEHAVHQILQKHGLNPVVSVARALLGSGIFESEAEARSRFPSVFEPAEQETAIPKQPTATVVPDHTSGLPGASCHPADRAISDGPGACGLATRKFLCQGTGKMMLIAQPGHKDSDASTQTQDNRILDQPYFVCSLGPQHELMTQIQKAMEHMCFAFAQGQMPKVLRAKKWSCPQAVKLSRWAKEFATRPELFAGDRPSSELLQSVESIWHTAVDREPLTIQQLQQLVTDATALSTMLAIPEYEKLFATLSTQLRFIAHDAKCRQRRRAKLEVREADITKRRLELDREERETIMKLKELDVGQGTAADNMVSKMVEQLTSDFAGIAAARLKMERYSGAKDTGEDPDSDADLDFC
ncbi:hypothetical protein Purlil1_12362 [Purpureocillium lilacinum]|uniref:Ubiquinol-cytochrome-c reductase cytochrome c1 n=1 Tax=Purpureocillium lilacinum TaxID=33203 RepID=A0ABR0BHK7_PURLI|nr:hypothetical protein Purlil1_12362 [Purpureocillium lilacinum]